MADRPFDTSLWARPGIPMRDSEPKPRRWYHLVIVGGVIFYLGFILGGIA